MICEFVKGKPYFSDTKEKIKQFPYLDKNIKCENLIIGGGINGCICAYYFAENNLDTILIDKHRIGYMNTSCATAILEYQLDELANDLTKHFDKQDIIDLYNLGLDSLEKIDDIIKKLGNHCHYSKRASLLYTLVEKEASELKREYDFRKNNGFKVSFLRENRSFLPFKFSAGLYDKKGGAEFNPYLFSKQVIEKASERIKIFEHTEATEIRKDGDGFKVITQYGIEIDCKRIIVCTGYNTKLFTKKKLCDKFISYTIVTSPLKKELWDRTLLQDNSDPYHYLRLSPDNRLIIGGEDTAFKNSEIKDKKAEKKYKKLWDYANLVFKDLLNGATIDYKFCGAFSATDNNLAVIGESPDERNLFYNLGYGANGIIYSIFGAHLLMDLFENKDNKFAKFFKVER